MIFFYSWQQLIILFLLRLPLKIWTFKNDISQWKIWDQNELQQTQEEIFWFISSLNLVPFELNAVCFQLVAIHFELLFSSV